MILYMGIRKLISTFPPPMCMYMYVHTRCAVGTMGVWWILFIPKSYTNSSARFSTGNRQPHIIAMYYSRYPGRLCSMPTVSRRRQAALIVDRKGPDLDGHKPVDHVWKEGEYQANKQIKVPRPAPSPTHNEASLCGFPFEIVGKDRSFLTSLPTSFAFSRICGLSHKTGYVNHYLGWRDNPVWYLRYIKTDRHSPRTKAALAPSYYSVYSHTWQFRIQHIYVHNTIRRRSIKGHMLPAPRRPM